MSGHYRLMMRITLRMYRSSVGSAAITAAVVAMIVTVSNMTASDRKLRSAENV
ncbi:MAG: hypothetical protein WA459_08410 [Stellaceae bacterium]